MFSSFMIQRACSALRLLMLASIRASASFCCSLVMLIMRSPLRS